MAYGDYSGPDKPNKGQEGGSCNRQRCQAEPADWYNHGSMKWYCHDCAIQIGQDHVNYRCWMIDWYPKCGHPQFETREMIDIREKARTPDLVIIDEIPPVYTRQIYRSPLAKPQSDSLKRMLGKKRRRP